MADTARVPTARDVAEMAGVSQATVSYVLSGRSGGRDRVSAETRQRVLQAVEALGYAPNQAARSLRRRRTDRICLVLPRFNAPHYDVLAEDVQRVASRHGYTVYLVVAGTARREREILQQLRRRVADGVIIEPRFVEGEDIAPLARAGVAVVVHSDYVVGSGFDVVRPMRAELSYQAMRHLLDKGHRRIAFVGNFAQHPVHYGRYDSYRRALEERGIAVDPRLVRAGSDSREESFQAVRALLQLEEPPTAVFSASDIGAISAIWAAYSLGRRVPDDLAVIGVGNTPEGRVSHPPLTTIGPVARDFTDLADLLFDRLQGNAPPEGRAHLRQWELILRGSA